MPALWNVVRRHGGVVQDAGDVAPALSFLFRISLGQVGKDYPVETLSPQQKELLKHFGDIGIVYRRKRGSARYYPTTTGTILTQNPHEEQSIGSGGGFIIVETNFKVYAYEPTEVQLAILDKFVNMSYRLPGLMCGDVDRDSVGRAFKKGITAEQLLTFLKTNSHPEMKMTFPTAVHKQITLWQSESERLQTHPGVVYGEFGCIEAFELIRAKARQEDALIYENSDMNPEMEKFIVCVKATKDKEIRNHFTAWKQEQQSAPGKRKRVD